MSGPRCEYHARCSKSPDFSPTQALATTSPSRPESAKTASSPRDAPYPMQSCSPHRPSFHVMPFTVFESDAKTKLAGFFGILLKDDEVVPMYDFLIFLRAELSLNLCCVESFDPFQGLGGEVYESFGELFAVLVEAAHRISCIEGAADVHNA